MSSTVNKVPTLQIMMKKDLTVFDISPDELESAPVERAFTLASDLYTSPQFDHSDKKIILGKHWQCVGHISRISEPGMAYPITVAGNPVLIIHSMDGEIRAFFNVCKHRGGPLLDKPGSFKFIKCLYHGWTYRTDGSLRGVPHFDRAELFDKDEFGLRPIHLEIRSGLIWINLCDSQPEVSLDEVLAGVKERVGHIDLSTLKFAGEIVYDVNCNWKVYADNYLEGYHVPHVHPELCDLLSFQDYTTECFKWYSLQYSPFRQKESIYSDGSGEAYYYFVYPNTMLNILPGRVQLNRIEPVDHKRCKVIFEYYYDDIESESAKKKVADDMEYSERVQQEDMDICEHVQRGLESVAYHKGRFSPKMETAVHHFQELVKADYKAYLNT